MQFSFSIKQNFLIRMKNQPVYIQIPEPAKAGTPIPMIIFHSSANCWKGFTIESSGSTAHSLAYLAS